MEGAENCTDRTAADRREGGDEEEMEAFFAEMQRLRNKLRQLQEGNARNNKRKRASGGGWAPAFRLEDFTAEIEFKRHVPAAPENLCGGDDVGNRKRDEAVEPKSQSPPNLKLAL